MPKSKNIRNSRKSSKRNGYCDDLVQLNEHAAGIDVGSEEHWVCVPPSGCKKKEDRVRRFGALTCDLLEIADWLKACGVTTVAMESTGVYWISLYQILENAGLDVWLVNARHVKGVPGRPKTDRLDCQWIQRLHCYGLLTRSFRPSGDICAIRSLWRSRDGFIEDYSRTVKRIQKSLHEMNVLLHKVVSDLTGKTGMAVMDAILAGERDPERLVKLCDPRIKTCPDKFKEALRGDYRDEQIELLGMALEQLRFIRGQIIRLDSSIEKRISLLPANKTTLARSALTESKVKPNKHLHAPGFDAVHLVQSLYGAPVGDIPGMGGTVLTGILAETGLDLTAWENEDKFAAWLSLSPKARISGGKFIAACSTAKTGNRAGYYFRQAASTLKKSKCALGQFYRRKQAQKGTKFAIVCTAHKLAVIFYHMVTRGTGYQYMKPEEYDEKQRERKIKKLKRDAASLGMDVTEKKSA